MESYYNKHTKRWAPSPYVENVDTPGWTDFVDGLEVLSQEVIVSKEKTELISPAYYDDVVYRKDENVRGWSFLSLDFDDGTPFRIVKLLLDSKAYHGELNLNYVMYTTAGHAPEHNKFRLFIPFDRDVKPDEMMNVWYGGFKMFGGLSDPTCKDRSRAYYIPGDYPNTKTMFASRVEGGTMDVDWLMKTYPKTVVPITPTTPFHQSSSTFSWTDLNNCPFVRYRWVNDYLCHKGVGHYSGVYKFMIRVAGQAKKSGYAITPQELGLLGRELDLRKDGRWVRQHRNFVGDATNAIKHVY